MDDGGGGSGGGGGAGLSRVDGGWGSGEDVRGLSR